MKNKITATIAKLRKFLPSGHTSSVSLNRDVTELKLELKVLETELNTVDNEKMELEKLLADFDHRYSMELGDLLLEILNLRKLLFQADETKYREAENDEKRYRQKVTSDKKQQKLDLADDEKQELKKKFRMATLLCHPDKVSDNNKIAAQETFIRLKNAYDSNDLKQVEKILIELGKGNFFQPKSETVLEREQLKAEIEKLRQRIETIKKEINSIKNSSAYKSVIVIDNWDDYFRKRKDLLKKELEEIKEKVENHR